MSADIRPLAEEDLPALKAVIDGVGLFPSAMLDGMTAAFLAEEATAERWYVLAEAGLPVALGLCAPERMTEGTWNLLLVAVSPARQGQGLGRRLTAHVERELRAEGARLLLVETSGLAEFERTRAVYGRLGYREVARIEGFYAEGEDKVVFRKDLRAAA